MTTVIGGFGVNDNNDESYNNEHNLIQNEGYDVNTTMLVLPLFEILF